MTEKKRIPRDAQAILDGALKLSIGERVKIVKALKESIDKELNELNQKLQETKEIVNGL